MSHDQMSATAMSEPVELVELVPWSAPSLSSLTLEELTQSATAKAYQVEEGGTTNYYIGFKGGVGWLPYIEMDMTMWIVVGVLVVLIIVAGLALLLIAGGYVYHTKGGVAFKKIFK